MRNLLKHKKLILSLLLSHLMVLVVTYMLTKGYYLEIVDERGVAEKQARTLFLKSQDKVQTSGDMLRITEKMWEARNKDDLNTVNAEYAKLNEKKEEMKKLNSEMDKLLLERQNYPFKYFEIKYENK